MRSLSLLASVLLAAVAPSALAAPPSVGYAQAADYLEKDAHPERYHPINVLDGRDASVWCAAPGSASTLTIGFKGVATVDEVRLYTGNGSEREAFKAFARAKKLTLEGKDSAKNFTVEDKRGLQTVPLNPLGGGDPSYHLVIGQVVGIHIDDRFIVNGLVDTAAMRPIARSGYRDYFVATPETKFSITRPGT